MFNHNTDTINDFTIIQVFGELYFITPDDPYEYDDDTDMFDQLCSNIEHAHKFTPYPSGRYELPLHTEGLWQYGKEYSDLPVYYGEAPTDIPGIIDHFKHIYDTSDVKAVSVRQTLSVVYGGVTTT